MRKYNTILFDLDGTVLDTSPGLLCSINDTIAQCSLFDITMEQKCSMIGPPIDKSFKEIYQMSDEQAADTAAVFRRAYSEKYLLEAELYPGILELMAELRQTGWKIGIATYKRNDYAQRLMQAMGINALCHFTLGSDGKKQTKADIIQICLEQLECKSSDMCIMVGDTIHDYLGAKNADTAFVGVTYGFGFRSCDEILKLGAVGACRSADELRSVFLDLQKTQKEYLESK